jgi:hypothetical protein
MRLFLIVKEIKDDKAPSAGGIIPDRLPLESEIVRTLSASKSPKLPGIIPPPRLTPLRTKD